MQIIPHTNQRLPSKSDLIKSVQKVLPAVFIESVLREEITRVLSPYGDYERDDIKNRRMAIQKATTKLPIKWNKRNQFDLLSFADPKTLDESQVFAAIMQNPAMYASHATAMYFLNLTDQRPHNFIISYEAPGKSPGNKKLKLDKFRVRQAFLKGPRITQNFFLFRKHKFSIVERLPVGLIGTRTKRIPVNNGEALIRYTDIERTFVDSLISPHYSGGIINILKAYSHVNLNIKVIKQYYDRLNPTYPIWQRIGFVLDLLGRIDDSSEWETLFGNKEKIDFYLTHSARPTWKFSKKWQLYFPEGLPNEN